MKLGTAIALACLLIVRHAYAETVLNAPEVHVGDSWTYSHTDGFTNEVTAEVRRRVVDVSDTEITTIQEIKGTKDQRTIYYDRNWNTVDDGMVKYTPSLDSLRFPLHASDIWKRKYQGRVLTTGREGVCYVTGKVAGQESVTVPAGTFDTVKIQDQVECQGTDADTVVRTFKNTVWYAPSVKRVVRNESSTLSDGRVRAKSIVVLIEYHLDAAGTSNSAAPPSHQ
jgi:hypothetical protein